jgi:hypothetical protein
MLAATYNIRFQSISISISIAHINTRFIVVQAAHCTIAFICGTVAMN